MDKTLGLLPVSSSNDDASESPSGGPVVLFSMLTACCSAYGQKLVGELLATRSARNTSMMERMARSATPFSWCTCGGQVVWWMSSSSMSSENSRDRNSPALSVCSAPTTDMACVFPMLPNALKAARNLRTYMGASDLARMAYAILNLV